MRLNHTYTYTALPHLHLFTHIIHTNTHDPTPPIFLHLTSPPPGSIYERPQKPSTKKQQQHPAVDTKRGDRDGSGVKGRVEKVVLEYKIESSGGSGGSEGGASGGVSDGMRGIILKVGRNIFM